MWRINPDCSATKRAAVPRYPRIAGKHFKVWMLFRRPAQHVVTAKGIVEVGGMHLNLQQVALDIHNHRALAALHLFTAIDSLSVGVVLGFDALRIDDSIAGAGCPMLFLRYRAFNSSKAASQTPLLRQRLKCS
jgi:hypothetical protein